MQIQYTTVQIQYKYKIYGDDAEDDIKTFFYYSTSNKF